MKTGLPDENKHVTLYDIKIKYTQPADGNNDTGDDIQELRVKTETNHGSEDDYYFVIETNRWAFDEIDEVIELLKDFKNRFKK